MGFRWRGVFGGSFETGYPFPFTEGVNMNELLYSLTGSAFLADLMQTALAASKLRLFKSTLVPVPETPLADFVTDEADFTGYPAGGATLTAWLDPILMPPPGSGYQIQSPMSQFATANPTTVGNVIGGWFLVETGGALIAYGTFGSPIPMEEPGQGIDLAPVLTFPTGS